MDTGEWNGKLINDGRPTGVPSDPAHHGVVVVDKGTGDHWRFDADRADWTLLVDHSERHASEHAALAIRHRREIGEAVKELIGHDIPAGSTATDVDDRTIYRTPAGKLIASKASITETRAALDVVRARHAGDVTALRGKHRSEVRDNGR